MQQSSYLNFFAEIFLSQCEYYLHRNPNGQIYKSVHENLIPILGVILSSLQNLIELRRQDDRLCAVFDQLEIESIDFKFKKFKCCNFPSNFKEMEAYLDHLKGEDHGEFSGIEQTFTFSLYSQMFLMILDLLEIESIPNSSAEKLLQIQKNIELMLANKPIVDNRQDAAWRIMDLKGMEILFNFNCRLCDRQKINRASFEITTKCDLSGSTELEIGKIEHLESEDHKNRPQKDLEIEGINANYLQTTGSLVYGITWEQIHKLVDISITLKDLRIYDELMGDLQEIIKPMYHHVKLFIFGSRLTGLARQESPLDVFVECKDFYNSGQFHDVWFLLEQYPEDWERLEMQIESKSPLIKTKHLKYNMQVNLYFRYKMSYYNDLLIGYMMDQQIIAKKMILFIKEWNISTNLHIHQNIIIVLVLFYMQIKGKLPSVYALQDNGKIKRKEICRRWNAAFNQYPMCTVLSTGEIIEDTRRQFKHYLEDFFEFYGLRFDFDKYVVCPFLGKPIEKKSFAETAGLDKAFNKYKLNCKESTTWLDVKEPLVVQDFFELNRNIAATLNQLRLERFKMFAEITAGDLKANEFV